MISISEMHAFRRRLDYAINPHITHGSYIDRTYYGQPFYFAGHQCCRYSAYVESKRDAEYVAMSLNAAFVESDAAGRAHAQPYLQKCGTYAGRYKVEVLFW